jgi:hypothetical protein
MNPDLVIIFNHFYNDVCRDKQWGHVIMSPHKQAMKLRRIRRFKRKAA